MERNIKTCTKCQKELDLEKYFEFRSDTKKYRNHCKLCNKGYIELKEDNIESFKKAIYYLEPMKLIPMKL